LLSGFAVIAGLELWPQRIPVVVIVLVVASDALLSRFLEMAAWAFQSVEMLGWTAGLNVFSCVTRLAGIVAIVLLGRPTLRAWAMAYFVGSATSAVVAVACVCRRLDPPKLGLHRIKGELREGFYFSVSLSATTLYNDIDKTMLARMSALDATGIYAAAYRLIDVAFIPVRSLLAAAYPGFFRSGAQGISSSVAYAKRLLPKPVGYAVAVAFAMWVAAPLVPRVLGAEYARTTIALRWLALLPLLKTFHYLGADALTGAGYQGLRTLMQVLVAAFNILVNLWIIPAYSWRGAAWSSLASDGLLASAIWLSLRALAWQRQRRLALVEIRA